MAFQSFTYFTFLPVMVLGYYLLPARARWAWLLAGSYFFYACWNAGYALLMLLSTGITFVAALLTECARTPSAKRLWLVFSLVMNLGILVYFKYWNLLADTLSAWLPFRIPSAEVLLPVGISFYIFQALGYTIDVYRGDIRATRHFGRYALFVSFFPQLVAGPIERSGNLLSQFDKPHRPDFEGMRHGALLILSGLIKKLVIADRLAVLVDCVYNAPAEYGAPAYVVATVCFAFQIYCDFCGYSEIAVGSAQLMGFRLMRNFERPYLSPTVGAFWRRWHVSLSGWFRDYLYIPLGGSRVSRARWVLNTLVVFLASGLWHGANWTFAAWGALNGVYLVVGRFTKPWRDRALQAVGIAPQSTLRRWLGVAGTFALVCFAWMLFRADSFAQVELMLVRFCTRWELKSLWELIYNVNGRECLLMVLGVAALVATELVASRRSLSAWLTSRPLPIRWGVYLALLFTLILLGKYNESPAFIYFQF